MGQLRVGQKVSSGLNIGKWHKHHINRDSLVARHDGIEPRRVSILIISPAKCPFYALSEDVLMH